MTPDHRYLILVDGGGTGCRGQIRNVSGDILSYATGGPANIRTDFGAAHGNITALIETFYQQVGSSAERRKFDMVWCGLAGAGQKDLATKLSKTLGFATAHVGTDREIAVEGALKGQDGIVAMVGTGSFFTCRTGAKDRHIGGWGFHLADDCSGAWLGRKLLRATVRAQDGLQMHSPLTQDIYDLFGGTKKGLVEFAQTAQPVDFGKLAPDIFKAALAGDITAQNLLNRAVARLHEILDTLDPAKALPIVLIGGLAPTYSDLLDPAYHRRRVPPIGDALDGAMSLARQRFSLADQG